MNFCILFLILSADQFHFGEKQRSHFNLCITHKLTRNEVPLVIGSEVTIILLGKYAKHFLVFEGK